MVASVLDAALAELGAVGYLALRLDDVAARAGVAKTTVYRRWPTKAELVRDAVRKGARYDEPLPDTGSVRGDLLVLLEQTTQAIQTPAGMAIARLMTMDTEDVEVASLCRSLKDDARARRAVVVARGQERGEIPPEVDAQLVSDAVFAVVMTRILRLREPVDQMTCERIVDLVVTGAEHGGGRAGRPVPRPAAAPAPRSRRGR